MKGGVSYVPDTLPNNRNIKIAKVRRRKQDKETKITNNLNIERNEERNYGT
jgi:hypothetical protein